jgi:PiT family inorganic phosphate transporter
MIEFVSLIAFLLIAFSIGTNDTSNAFGICIGCRIISLRKSAILLFFLVLLGLNLQGNRVIKTVGKDLVATNAEITAIALMVSAIIILITNLRGIPVSTHQVIVGSLSGAGVAFGARLSYGTLAGIIISWILSPIVAGFIAILLFILLERATRGFSLLKVERTIRILLLSSGILISYNMGANEVATAIAPLAAIDGELYLISVLSAAAVSLGALALSRKIAETLCKGITSIDPKTGFSAHFGAGLSVYIFTLLGMPVSTTYSLVGGISALGFFKGVKTVKTKKIREIVLNWIAAPLLAFFFGYTSSLFFLGL